MQPSDPATVSLTSTWFLRPGSEAQALRALARLAEQVYEREPDTLVYRIHVPYTGDARLQALPPPAPTTVLFFEEYRNADAFLAHVHGAVFKTFVQEHGALFAGTAGTPFMTATFLARHAGFVRGLPVAARQAENRHPCGMFEIIARDQDKLAAFYHQVFGWRYQSGTGGFAYVHFDVPGAAALGGIGKADPSIPGYAAGSSFYLLVDDLPGTIAAAVAAGGRCTMPPASADGYGFAMIADPEDNVIGLLKTPHDGAVSPPPGRVS